MIVRGFGPPESPNPLTIMTGGDHRGVGEEAAGVPQQVGVELLRAAWRDLRPASPDPPPEDADEAAPASVSSTMTLSVSGNLSAYVVA